MQKKILIVISCIVFHFFSLPAWAESPQLPSTNNDKKTAVVEITNGAPGMLASLLELQRNLKEQLRLSRGKLKNSKSEAEKIALQTEITQLDRQFSETTSDFERIATGVEPALFSGKKEATFSWKDELSSLVEPAIKELKRFTVRVRQKSDLKDKIAELRLLETAAQQAVVHLQTVLAETKDKEVQKKVMALQPEWINIEKRLRNKLELAERELAQLEEQEVSLVEATSNSLRKFFKKQRVVSGCCDNCFCYYSDGMQAAVPRGCRTLPQVEQKKGSTVIRNSTSVYNLSGIVCCSSRDWLVFCPLSCRRLVFVEYGYYFLFGAFLDYSSGVAKIVAARKVDAQYRCCSGK